jgi:methionyl-tRNA formyltransferase
VPALRALVGAGHDIALVVTQPDRRRGRGPQLSPSPVKAAAVELGLPVSAKVDDVLTVEAELGVVVAFGRLIKPHVLADLDMVNVHFSLLPRWRGAAPVERAILAGDAETGVCLMALEEGLDTGDVYTCERVMIGPEETADELRRRLTDVGTELLVTALERGRESLPTPRPQTGEPTYAAKLDPAELYLDWARPAVELHRLVRLGRAWTTVRGRRLEVVRARVAPGPPSPGSPGRLEGLVVATGDGALALVEVKPEGRGVVPADSWLRGARLADGEVLGS